MPLNAFPALNIGLVSVLVVSSQAGWTDNCPTYYVDVAAGKTYCYTFFRATAAEMVAEGADSDWSYMTLKCADSKVSVGKHTAASSPVSINSQNEENRLRQLLDAITDRDSAISRVVLGAAIGQGTNFWTWWRGTSGSVGWLDDSSTDFIKQKVPSFDQLEATYCLYMFETGFGIDKCFVPTGNNHKDEVLVICKAVLDFVLTTTTAPKIMTSYKIAASPKITTSSKATTSSKTTTTHITTTTTTTSATFITTAVTESSALTVTQGSASALPLTFAIVVTTKALSMPTHGEALGNLMFMDSVKRNRTKGRQPKRRLWVNSATSIFSLSSLPLLRVMALTMLLYEDA